MVKLLLIFLTWASAYFGLLVISTQRLVRDMKTVLRDNPDLMDIYEGWPVALAAEKMARDKLIDLTRYRPKPFKWK